MLRFSVCIATDLHVFQHVLSVAFAKTQDGRVIWDGDKCIGCRYCMVACPFQIPTFEYEKKLFNRTSANAIFATKDKERPTPRLYDICPWRALTFGPRTDLIKVARDRIKRNPDSYYNYNLWWERGWRYRLDVFFSQTENLKIWISRNSTTNPAPGVSEAIQHGIFAYFCSACYALRSIGNYDVRCQKNVN